MDYPLACMFWIESMKVGFVIDTSIFEKLNKGGIRFSVVIELGEEWETAYMIKSLIGCFSAGKNLRPLAVFLVGCSFLQPSPSHEWNRMLSKLRPQQLPWQRAEELTSSDYYWWFYTTKMVWTRAGPLVAVLVLDMIVDSCSLLCWRHHCQQWNHLVYVSFSCSEYYSSSEAI